MSWNRTSPGKAIAVREGTFLVKGGELTLNNESILHNCTLPRPPGMIFHRNRIDLHNGDTYKCDFCGAEHVYKITWADDGW